MEAPLKGPTRWPDGGDLDALPQVLGVTSVRRKIDSMEWPENTHIDFHDANFATNLLMHSKQNDGYGVPEQIDELINWLGETFPGTHGLIYERDDEHLLNVGDDAYRVRAMVRGRCKRRPIRTSPRSTRRSVRKRLRL